MNNQDIRNTPVTGTRFNYGYIMVIAGFIIVMITVGTFISIGVFFKPILNDFGWSRAVTSGPLAVATLMSGLIAVFAGAMTDKYGPRLVLTICSVLTAIGYLLMSRLSSIWELYLYYGVLVGIGGSVLVPLLSIVPRWFEKRRTIMVGIISAGGGVGGLVFPLVSNWLINAYTWPKAYLYLGIANLIIIPAACQLLKKNPIHSVRQEINDASDKAVTPSMPVGIPFATAFRTRQFWVALCVFFGFGFTAATMQFHLVNHATDINISSTASAGLLSLINAMSVIGSIGLGAVGDRFGNKKTVIYSFFVLTTTLIWLVFIGNLWMLNLFAVIYGLAFGSGLANPPSMMARLFGTISLGLIIGIATLCQTLGSSLGAFMAGYIFDVFNSYDVAFIICGIFCAGGAIATIFLKPVGLSAQREATQSTK